MLCFVCMGGGRILGGLSVLHHQVDKCLFASVGGNQNLIGAWQRALIIFVCSSSEWFSLLDEAVIILLVWGQRP